ncbi:MAG TPA: peptidoglycan DD-metalloendopeptidase family protein [Bacteroidales bacterium]|nr:peptidoglycan DD-metalloendopeptidase family protein [Bacteroidales bacterium]
MFKPVKLLLIAISLVLVSSVIYTVFQKSPGLNGRSGNVDSTAVALAEIKREYGLAIDSFDIVKGKVKRNAFLSDVLEEFNVPGDIIHGISEAAKGIFDLNKFRAGNPFAVFRSKDDNQVKYFIYEHTPTEYIIVNLSDSVLVTKHTKNIRKEHREVFGEINTSLWNTMKDQGINPLVALQLSELYAWNIDFFGLQKGDAFKVIYDEAFVDTLSVGINKIKGAWFRHGGQEYYAIPFTQDGVESYYGIDGKSLRRAFLKAPLRFSRISSRFSNSRLHPVLKIRRPHHGVDYAAPAGTPVEAIGDGTVIELGYHGGGGRQVKIRHNGTYTTAYLHLKGYGPGLHNGSHVAQGQVIGYVGSSGLSTGPHLDFRVWRNNTPVDPLSIESPSVEPVKDNLMPDFSKQRDVLVASLNKIQQTSVK